MNQVRMRFVCSGEGRHKERTLGTVLCHDTPSGVELSFEDPRQRQGSSRPNQLRGRAREIVGEVAEFQFHLMDNLDMEPPTSSHMRLRSSCPNCRYTPTISGERMEAFADALIERGGTYTIDISTGAIVHKS